MTQYPLLKEYNNVAQHLITLNTASVFNNLIFTVELQERGNPCSKIINPACLF